MNASTHKTCSKCGETKPRDEFPVAPTVDGRKAACRKCAASARAINREANAVRELEYKRRYYEAHPEVQRRINARYRERNLPTVRNRQQIYRALRAGVAISDVDRAAVIARDNSVCSLCGVPVDQSIRWPDPQSLTLDHAVPLSKGGAHDMSNLFVAHLICNQKKGDKIA